MQTIFFFEKGLDFILKRKYTCKNYDEREDI